MTRSGTARLSLSLVEEPVIARLTKSAEAIARLSPPKAQRSGQASQSRLPIQTVRDSFDLLRNDLLAQVAEAAQRRDIVPAGFVRQAMSRKGPTPRNDAPIGAFAILIMTTSPMNSNPETVR